MDGSFSVLRQGIRDRRFPEGAAPDLTDPHVREIIDRLCGGVPLLLNILVAALHRCGNVLAYLDVEEILAKSGDVGVASAFVEKSVRRPVARPRAGTLDAARVSAWRPPDDTGRRR